MRAICLPFILSLSLLPLALPHFLDSIPEDGIEELIDEGDAHFYEEYSEEDEDTGGSLKFTARGKMADNVINVDIHKDIRKVKCEDYLPDVVLIAIHEGGCEDLVPGVILLGGEEWGCASGVKNRTWDGLLRRVRSVEKRSPTVLEVATEQAEFMDMFAHAHMKYQYVPGARNNPVTKHRRKRAACGAEEAGLSVAQWVTMIDWRVQAGEPIVIQDTRDVMWETTNQNVPFSFTCEACQINITSGLELELFKPEQDPVTAEDPKTHYNLRLNGTMSIKQTVKASIGTTLSKAGTFVSEDVVEMPNIQSIEFSTPPEAGLDKLKMNISVRIGYEGMVDAKAKIGQDITTVTSISGAFDLNLDIVDGRRGEPVYSFTFEPEASSSEITEMDVRGRGNVGLTMNPVIEFIPSIQWSYRGALHWDDIQSNFKVMVKPQLSHKATVEDSIVCLETLTKGLFSVSNNDISIDVTIFANPAGFWKEELNSFDLEYDEEIMTEVEATCSVEGGCCRVDCFGPEEAPAEDLSMAEVVSVTSMTPEPDLLEVKSGPDFTIAGAKAKFTGRFALFMLKLIKFVAASRPGSKLILKLGYNVNTEIYNEGRAAEVQMSAEGSDAPDTDTAVLNRLAQLAVCVGYEYVKVKGNAVEIAAKTTPLPSPTRLAFEQNIDVNAPNLDSALCDEWPTLFPELSVGQTNPADKTAIEVCGGVDDPVSRMEADSFSGFYCYQFSDVIHKDEEADADWCLSNSRLCFPCDPSATEPYKYCADCVMTAYMAFLLRRWATIVNAQGGSVKILDAWVEATADREGLEHHAGAEFRALNYEGRALYAEVTGVSVGVASKLAACASFDFVEVIDASTIYVAARKSSRDGMLRIGFPSNSLLAVDTPVTTDKFDWHPSFASETYQVQLFDSHGVEEEQLSNYFKVKDFLYPLDVEKTTFERYFRLDPHLVFCLDFIQSNTRETFKITTAYKPIDRNLYGLDERHEKESYRYTSGQAVVLEYDFEGAGLDDYVALGKRILRRCSPDIRSQNLGVGVGIYRTHIYVHTYENPNLDGKVTTEMWLERDLANATSHEFVDDTIEAFDQLQWQLQHGGPAIAPMDETRVCDNHPLTLGDPDLEWKGFMSYRLANDRDECTSTEWTEYCTSTEQERLQVFHKVKDGVLSQVQPDNLKHEYFFQGLKGCFWQSCGPCAGDGPTWANKVHNCTDVARFFFQETAHDSFHNNFNFFNEKTFDEDMRADACGDGQLCKSKTNAYSMLLEPLETRYSPDGADNSDVEELVYSSNQNPMPNIVDQSLAMEVSGNVTVWISDKEDWESQKKVVRALMIYNNKVEYVHFKFYDMPEQDVAIIRESLQRFLDIWAGNACPLWARTAGAPYSFTILGPEVRRKKRAVTPAEYLRRKRRNWELEWILRN